MKLRGTLLLFALVALLMACISGCCDGSSTVPAAPAGQVLDFDFFHIEGFITGQSGSYKGDGTFGSEASSNVSLNGLLTLAPGASIDVAIPADYGDSDVVLEIQLSYMDGGQANFELQDDQGTTIAAGIIEDDEFIAIQTHTLLVDVSAFEASEFFRLINNSTSYVLQINAFAAILRLEETNRSGVYVADLRGPLRIDSFATDAEMTNWKWSVTTPADRWSSGNLVFEVSDIIGPMTQPIVEFNFGRVTSSAWISLYDDQDALVGEYYSDSYSEDATGNTLLLDLTDYRASEFFRLKIGWSAYVAPFLKIYDAAVDSGRAVLLDVSPQGRDFVEATGRFALYPDSDYPAGGIAANSLEYDAPHWLVDPYGPTDGPETVLEFRLPAVVATYEHPVVEIVHFSPDSSSESIEFYLLDENNQEIAHVFFDEWEGGEGSILKNQIPLEQFKTSATLKLRVPAGRLMALPPFIKVFDAAVGTPVLASR